MIVSTMATIATHVAPAARPERAMPSFRFMNMHKAVPPNANERRILNKTYLSGDAHEMAAQASMAKRAGAAPTRPIKPNTIKQPSQPMYSGERAPNS